MMKNTLPISLIAFILSFCSFSYQTLIAFTVQAAVGGGLLPWLLVLGAFLFGIGLGTWKVGKAVIAKPNELLIWVEYRIVFIGMLAVFFVLLADGLAKISTLGYATYQGSVALMSICTSAGVLTALFIGYFTGFELPCILDQQKINGHAGENYIIASHYFGNLASAIIVQVWLIPGLDVFLCTLLVAVLNLAVAVFLIIKERANVSVAKNIFVVLGFLVILFGLKNISSDFYQAYLKVSYFRPHISEYNWPSLKNMYYVIKHSAHIHRQRSHHQYIDIVNLPSIKNEKMIDTMLYLDTHLQFGSSDEKIYHELMTHVPISYYGRVPKKALIIGGGDGLLVRELLRYEDQLTQIDLVELDPFMIDLGKNNHLFKKLNQSSLHSKKVNIIIDDAFSVLKKQGHIYDFILIDLPYPHNPDLAKLHSVEFYKLVRRRLAPDGFIVLDFPIKLKNFESGDRNDILFNSLSLAGFKHFLPFYGYDTFITASLIEPSTQGALNNGYISEQVIKELTNQSQILDGVTWNPKYANSIFKPKSYGRDF